MKGLKLLALAVLAAGCSGGRTHWHGTVAYADGDRMTESSRPEPDRVTEAFGIREARELERHAGPGTDWLKSEVEGRFSHGRSCVTESVEKDGVVAYRMRAGGNGSWVPGMAVKAVDVDGDGLDEVVVAEIGCRDGRCAAQAWLVTAEGEIMAELGQVYARAGAASYVDTVSVRASGAGLEVARVRGRD